MTFIMGYVVVFALVVALFAGLCVKWQEELLDVFDSICVDIRDNREEKGLKEDKLIMAIIYTDSMFIIVRVLFPILSIIFGVTLSVDMFSLNFIGTAYLYQTIPIVIGMIFAVQIFFNLLIMLFIYIVYKTRSV